MLPVAIDLGIAIALVPTDDGVVRLTLAETGETREFDRRRVGRAPGRLDRLRGRDGLGAGRSRAGRDRLPRRAWRRTCRRAPGCRRRPRSRWSSAWALSGGDRPARGLDGPRPPGAAVRERLHRAQQRDHGPVRVDLRRAGASALLLDCRSLEHRAIRLADDDLALVACHSGSPRRLETSAYNERRAQCEAAVAAIAALEPGVTALRDVTPAMLEAVRDRAGPDRRRRAPSTSSTRTQRVLDAIAAFEAGDLDDGRPAVLREPRLAARPVRRSARPSSTRWSRSRAPRPGVIGARLTGAGFGGCTINLVRRDAVPALREAVLRDYPARTGLTPRVFEVEASAGARRLA